MMHMRHSSGSLRAVLHLKLPDYSDPFIFGAAALTDGIWISRSGEFVDQSGLDSLWAGLLSLVNRSIYD